MTPSSMGVTDSRLSEGALQAMATDCDQLRSSFSGPPTLLFLPVFALS
jgi:hypothetical protein